MVGMVVVVGQQTCLRLSQASEAVGREVLIANFEYLVVAFGGEASQLWIELAIVVVEVVAHLQRQLIVHYCFDWASLEESIVVLPHCHVQLDGQHS